MSHQTTCKFETYISFVICLFFYPYTGTVGREVLKQALGTGTSSFSLSSSTTTTSSTPSPFNLIRVAVRDPNKLLQEPELNEAVKQRRLEIMKIDEPHSAASLMKAFTGITHAFIVVPTPSIPVKPKTPINE